VRYRAVRTRPNDPLPSARLSTTEQRTFPTQGEGRVPSVTRGSPRDRTCADYAEVEVEGRGTAYSPRTQPNGFSTVSENM